MESALCICPASCVWLGCCWVTGPYEHSAILVAGALLDLGKFLFQVVKIVVVKVKLTLQRPIRDPSMPLEQCQRLFKHFVEVHHDPLRYGVRTAVSHAVFILTEHQRGLQTLKDP